MTNETKSKNMEIWNAVEMTDPKYIKNNGNLSAIDGYYFFKRATDIFGAIGDKWGYEILFEDFIDAAPMIINNEVIGVGKVHTLKIMFWYKNVSGERCSFEQFGHTKYMYLTNSLKVLVDDEYAKKSLTDAIKKALSMLGFCADVYMNMFKDKDYENMARVKANAEKAIDLAETTAKNKKDLLGWVKLQCELYKKIPNKQACELILVKHKNQITLKCKVLNENPIQLLKMVEDAENTQIELLSESNK